MHPLFLRRTISVVVVQEHFLFCIPLMLIVVVYAVAVGAQYDAALRRLLVCRLEPARANELIDATIVGLLNDVMKVQGCRVREPALHARKRGFPLVVFLPLFLLGRVCPRLNLFLVFLVILFAIQLIVFALFVLALVGDGYVLA